MSEKRRGPAAKPGQDDARQDATAPAEAGRPSREAELQALVDELWAKIDLLGDLGSRREADWRRLHAKLSGRIEQLTTRIGKRDDTVADKNRAIALLENRSAKLRDRLGEAKRKVDELTAELETRLPRARVRMQIGRTALVSFDEGAHEGAPDQSTEAALDTPAPEVAVEAPAVGESERTDVSEDAAETDADGGNAVDPQTREIRRLVTSPSIGRSDARFGRIAFYTAIAGDYDVFAEPAIVDARADYFLFTDQPPPDHGSAWRVRPFDHADADDTRSARYVKLHPHVYFDGYDYAIWMDASLRSAAVAEEFIASDPAADLIAWRHPERDCVYDEAEQCLALGKDDPHLINAQMQRLRVAGYPEHAGLIESSVLVINLRSTRVRGFLDDWWAALASGSKRDQLSFNPTLRAHPEITLGYFAEAGISSRNDPRIIYRHHRGLRTKG